MELTYIFNAVITKLYYARLDNPAEFDGLGYWHMMRAIIAQIPDICSDESVKSITWINSPNTAEVSDKILSLNECDDEGHIIPEHHFIRQLINIPAMKPCNFLRLMQIALDIGQFMAVREQNKELLEIYELNDITDYIEMDVLLLINFHIKRYPKIIHELLSM